MAQTATKNVTYNIILTKPQYSIFAARKQAKIHFVRLVLPNA